MHRLVVCVWRVFRMSQAVWWGVLVPISFVMVWLLTAVHLPSGVLLGCMLSGILLSSQDIQLSTTHPVCSPC